MNPVLRLRLWFHRASPRAKLGVAGIVAVILAAVVVAVVVTSGSSKGTSVSAGPNPASGGSANCPASTTAVKVGVVLAAVGNGGALNVALGLPSVNEQKADFQAVFDNVNATGGAKCHQLQPVFQAFNYLDPASTETSCLNLVQAGVIAMLGGYSATSTNDCPLQHDMAVFDSGTVLLPSELQHFYPYYFGTNVGLLYNDFAHVAANAGYFTTKLGTGKLGVVYRDCVPQRVDLLEADLNTVGVQNDRMSKFDLGCPSAYPSPATLEQAVLQFKQAGVTVAVSIADSDMPALTQTAEQQGFRPQWAMPDEAVIATTIAPTASKLNPTDFNGAFVVAGSRYGDDPSAATDPATTECNAIMEKAGLKSIAASPAYYAGAACDYVWTLRAAVANAQAPVSADLAAGLQKQGSLALAFPAGPTRFDKGDTFSDAEWRVVRFEGSCGCWTVPDPTFHASF
jgi:hypothetical protein